MKDSYLSLHPEHLADLKKSGLSDETIREAGIYSAPPNEIHKLLGWTHHRLSLRWCSPIMVRMVSSG